LSVITPSIQIAAAIKSSVTRKPHRRRGTCW
jgi:hypothetical protein